MTDNEVKREKIFEEELPYVEERIKEVFNNYHNPNGCEDRLEICVLRDCKRTIRKAKEEINRQKAEIEELKNYVNRCKSGKEYWVKCLLEKPNEALKEFAERIKMSIKANVVETLCNDVKGVYKAEYVLDDVDNLLKEMVSEKE